ncbi:LuxR C-terminal-related transcriptional regulator [Leifsonia sp. P73]|uniref:response regulator transcription factor n=1 Tax=Leifsonia sp. P73 TaxID=3423959 RepID=UPI003DA6807A
MKAGDGAKIHVAIALEIGIARDALTLVLGSTSGIVVSAEASSLRDIERIITTQRVDVLLLDLRMPGMCAPAYIKRLRELAPSTRVIGVGWSAMGSLRQKVMESGAVTVISAASGHAELLRSIAGRKQQIGAATASAEPARTEVLSARELDVVQLLALGLTNREIATELFIVEGTVKRHVNSIFRKLTARSRVDVVRRAERLGLLQHQ